MILRVLGHGFHYEGENLCRVFFPHEKITVTKNGEGEDFLTVITFMSEENGKADIEVSVTRLSGAYSRASAPQSL